MPIYALTWLLIALAAFTLCMWAAWAVLRLAARRNAHEVYQRRREEAPASLRGLSEEAFTTAFMRSHGARGQRYMAAVLTAVTLGTPLLMTALRHIWLFFWDLAGRPPYYQEGLLIWAFYFFFALVGAWAAIAGIGARLYHRRAPGPLDDELIRASAGRR